MLLASDLLWQIIKREITGVGVKPFPDNASLCITTLTPLAISTEIALAKAGSDNAWVSLPKNSGPLMPLSWRYSAIA